MPLVERIITLDGPAVKNPKIVIAPVGTRISHLMNELEFKGEVGKVVIGGPMNGHAAYSTESPIVKVANAVLFFGEKDCKTVDYSACIHCGRCISACPLNLMPPDICRAYAAKDTDSLNKLKVMLCMNCGCCTYACPAKRPVAETNQFAKALVMAQGRK
jgi:electron transport complex protein RnfC